MLIAVAEYCYVREAAAWSAARYGSGGSLETWRSTSVIGFLGVRQHWVRPGTLSEGLELRTWEPGGGADMEQP
jgi:hypothetical protein